MASRPSTKFTVSFAAGLLLIPLAAVMAVALTSDSQPESAGADELPSTTLPEVQQVVFGAVGEATSDDLAVACGSAGLALVAAEAEGTINPVQQAALDALRPICEGQGTPLPGKPEPDAITRTVTVQKEVVVAAPAEDTTTTSEAVEVEEEETSTTQTTEGRSEDRDGGDDDDDEERRGASQSAEEKYLSVYDQAVGEIQKAVDQNGDPEKIEEAQRKLAEARKRAEAGNFKEATVNAYEAIGSAREAIGEGDDD